MDQNTENFSGGAEYSLKETIAQLDGWRRGIPMLPIEVAHSAKHWLRRRASNPPHGGYPISFHGTRELVDEWLQNEMRYIPEETALAMLFWLRQCDRVPMGVAT